MNAYWVAIIRNYYTKFGHSIDSINIYIVMLNSFYHRTGATSYMHSSFILHCSPLNAYQLVKYLLFSNIAASMCSPHAYLLNELLDVSITYELV
jgi:hypothetical protein